MGKIVIKKRVSLEFLGEDYKDAYLDFQSIPLKEYDKYVNMAKDKDEVKATNLVLDTLKEKFIGGKFPDENGELFDIEKSQIEEFDITVAIQAFKILTGQDQDPKA